MFSRSDVHCSKKETLYHGFFKLIRLTLSHPLFQGGRSRDFTREVLLRGTAVAVLPWDPDRDEVALVEQFRVGAQVAGDENPWLWEVVAGMQDKPNEDLEDVVRRELMEEAGLVPKAIRHLYDYYPSPGGTDEKIALFVAEVDLSDVQPFHGVDTENEDIRLHRIPRAQLPVMQGGGQINNSATLLSLMWLQIQLSQRPSGLLG